MFFYRDTVIQAKTKEELYKCSECPICHNKLAPDWKMPFRYEPTALFRMLIIGGAFAFALSLLLIKLEANGWLDFLDRLYYSTRITLEAALMICTCLPAAFFVLLGEIKLAHWTHNNMIAFGLNCPTCGNGYVGLVGEDDPEEPREESGEESAPAAQEMAEEKPV